MQISEMKCLLKRIYSRALTAVDPYKAVSNYFRDKPVDFSKYRKIILAGFGKAGVPMARAVETTLGERLFAGRIIVKEGYGGKLEQSRVYEAAHPEPDRRGEEATRETISFLKSELNQDDLLILVISGGGSALSPLPVPQITLTDKQKATAVLINCGATIQEINTIRKHLSQVKGGRLLEFCGGATVLSLVLSDVIGDDFASIASGPVAPDPTHFTDCLRIIDNYGIGEELSPSVLQYLQNGTRKKGPQETPKPGDERFRRVKNVLVGSNIQALTAASKQARQEGYTPLIISSSIGGNTGDVAKFHVAVAEEVLSTGNPIAAPCCLISGGETTVRIRGDGKGGRNMEFALQCASELRSWDLEPVLFASLGSDGTDGPTDAAGGTASHETVAKARNLGLSIDDYLKRNDSYHFLERTGDLIKTGPTQTNVMDLRFVLIGEPSELR
jgi:hydroxypyruvate reductase